MRRNLDRYVLAGTLLLGPFLLDAFPLRAASYVTGAAGLIALHEQLRRKWSPAVALTTSLLILGATSLWWSMAHARSPREAVAFGATSALMFAATAAASSRARAFAWTATALVPFLSAVIFAGSLPWDEHDLSTLALPRLYSSAYGLFSLTPVVYAAAIGLVCSMRAQPVPAAVSILIVLSWIALLPHLTAGSANEPFRHGLTAAIALLAPGLAWLIDAARRRPVVAVAPLVVGAALWNYWLMVQFTSGALPKDGPVSFAAMVRQQADVHTRGPYVYPFALPASAYFAWREGVPIERFARLVGEQRQHSIDLTLERAADRFLLEGFGGVRAMAAGPARELVSPRATLLLPPLHAPSTSLNVEVILSALDPSARVPVALFINGQELAQTVAGPEPAALATVLAHAQAERVFRAGYNRLSIVTFDRQRRLPSLAIYRIRIAPVA